MIKQNKIKVSDHGMTNTSSDKALFVDDYLDMSKIDVYDSYPSK